MKNQSKVIFGIGIWFTLIITFFTVCYILTQSAQVKEMVQWSQKQKDKYFVYPLNLKIEFDDWVAIRAGDKIYLSENSEEYKGAEVGTVYAKSTEEYKYNIYVRIYPEYEKHIGKDSTFLMVNEPGSPVWVMAKMLPKERREEIRKIFNEYLELHAKNIQKQLVPIINEVAKESYELLQKNFSVVMEKYKQKLIEKLKQAEKEHVDDEIRNLWDTIIWPIVLEESNPVISPIVDELWKKFPKGKIVMLWLYQSIPGTDKNHVQKRVEEYLQDQAAPIVENHKEELAQLLITITKRLGTDEDVKKSFLKMLKNVLSDKELFDILKELLLELYKINKDTFTQKMQEKWSDEHIQESLTEISSDFEKYLIKMINNILITENREIRPELAQVLRRQILYKDKYYLSVTVGKQKIEKLSPPVFVGKIND